MDQGEREFMSSCESAGKQCPSNLLPPHSLEFTHQSKTAANVQSNVILVGCGQVR